MGLGESRNHTESWKHLHWKRFSKPIGSNQRENCRGTGFGPGAGRSRATGRFGLKGPPETTTFHPLP